MLLLYAQNICTNKKVTKQKFIDTEKIKIIDYLGYQGTEYTLSLDISFFILCFSSLLQNSSRLLFALPSKKAMV